MTAIRAIALVLVVAVGHARGEATLSLKAIAKNGVLITPTNNLTVAPNDTIVAEVAFSSWSTPPFDDPANTGLVQTFQATLLGAAGAASNGADYVLCFNRLVLPLGWDAPIVKDHCPCDNPKFPTCDSEYGCVGPAHNPSLMANLNVVCNENDTDLIGGSCTSPCCFGNHRSDLIFYGFPYQDFVALQSLNILWGGTVDGFDAQQSRRCTGGANFGGFCNVAGDCPGGICDANFQTYAGTLNLKVGSQACGTYTFTFANDVNQTFISNAAANPVSRVPVNIQGLTLNTGMVCPEHVGACCDQSALPNPICTNCVHIAACIETGKRYGGDDSICATLFPPCIEPPWPFTSPPHCAIDARIPHIQGAPAQRRGFTSITFAFENAPSSAEDAPDDFEVTQIPELPAPPNPPPIQSVVLGYGNTVTVKFPSTSPIWPDRWTCIRHIASNKRSCLGFLPGDANGNGAALPSDILDIIDNLNRVRAGYVLPIQLCDIDRSGQCLPADIITEIDLLNGNGFPLQNGDSLPPCPSTIP